MRSTRPFEPSRNFAAAAVAVNVVPEVEALTPEQIDELVRVAAEAARAEGWAEGVAVGRADALAEINAAICAALEQLSVQIAAVIDGEAAAIRAVEARGTRLIFAVAQKLAPRLSEREAQNFAELVVQRAIEASGDAPAIEIFVAAELFEPLSKKMESCVAASARPNGVSVLVDPALRGASVRASWRYGGVEFDPAAMQPAVEALIANSLAALPKSETQRSAETKENTNE